MNLVIDQGNTICKLALYEGQDLLTLKETRRLDLALLKEVLDENHPVLSAIYSSVSLIDSEVINYLKGKLQFCLELKESTPVPIDCSYDRKQLGGDRLAAVVAAQALDPSSTSSLVIDLGTAITIEHILNGRFVGGNISPGFKLRLRSLHEHTSRLPLTEISSTELGFGQATTDAISQGVLQGILYEIMEYIRSIKEREPQTQIFLTGGYSDLLAQFIPSDVQIKKDMVLYGLNCILEYNKNVTK